MAWKSFELWDHALRGLHVARTDIEHMLKAETQEDLWLDWKGGKLVGAAKGGLTLQRAVAGFANAEGGVLVLGCNGGDAGTGEVPWSISACPATVGKASLRDWVEQQLVPLRSSLRPLPRVMLVDGGIVLIAIQRSDTLVPVVLPGKGPMYFLRFYGATHEVPEYLLAALVLGRRQRPRLDIRIVEAYIGEKGSRRSPADVWSMAASSQRSRQPWPINFSVEVHNSGLVWAEDVSIGLVVHGKATEDDSLSPPRIAGPVKRIPTSVEACIQGRRVDPFHLDQLLPKGKGDLAPFGTHTFAGLVGWTPSMVDAAGAWDRACSAWWYQHHPGAGRPANPMQTHWRVHWLAPLYVLTRNGPPQWFQVDLTFDEHGWFMNDESSVEPANDMPIVDIRAFHRRIDGKGGWVRVAGWGANPLQTEDDV